MIVIEFVGDYQSEHRVAEKLEPLVGMFEARPAAKKRTMGEGQQQEVDVAKRVPDDLLYGVYVGLVRVSRSATE
jgi:hypothetical protein